MKKAKTVKVKAHTRTIRAPKAPRQFKSPGPPKDKPVEDPKDASQPKEYGDVKLIPLGVTDAPKEYYDSDGAWSVGVLSGRGGSNL